MRVFKCLFNGDELFSDAYKMELIEEDSCYRIESSFVKKGAEQICIASDDVMEEDDNAETVNRIADAFELNEIQWSKKDFMAWVKPFMKRTLEKLTELGKEDRIAPFKKGATTVVKKIAGEWDEYQVFCGKAYDMEGSIVFVKTENVPEGSDDYIPVHYIFADALREEKF